MRLPGLGLDLKAGGEFGIKIKARGGHGGFPSLFIGQCLVILISVLGAG
jgi:hypothetical protein